MLTIIRSSVEYVSKMKEIFLRNWKYSSPPPCYITFHVIVYKLRYVSASIQSFKMLSCSMLRVPYFRNRNIKPSIKPTVMYIGLHIRKTYFFHCTGYNLTSCYSFWLLFGISETNRLMSIILIDCAIYGLLACAWSLMIMLKRVDF